MMRKVICFHVVFYFVACSHLFYHPSSEIFSNPEESGFKVERVSFQTGDQKVLKGWYFRGFGKSKKITVIQFHGNAENMSTHYRFLSWVVHHGYDLFTFDYRGYGDSEGEPSQKGLNEDAVTAIRWAFENRPEFQFILFGQSLGGAVLMRAYSEMAAPERERVLGLVIDSSFHSYKTMGRRALARSWLTFLFQPLGALMVSDEYSPEEVISKISPTPLLVIHGTQDPVVGFENGKEIYELGRPPKEFWEVEGGGHLAALGSHQKIFQEKLLQYWSSLVQKKISPDQRK